MPADAQSPAAASGRGRHVVVVGAGIAGLAAARAIVMQQPSARVTVLEGAAQTGGKLRLGEVAGQPVDLGAEAILNRRPEGIDLAQAVGLGDGIVHPVSTSAGIWSRGAVRPLPRTVMGVPADLGALAGSGIVGRRAVPRARLERVMRPFDPADDVAIGALVGHRIGGEIRDRLVDPMLGGVYAGRSDELSLHATVPQLVPALTEHGSLLAAAEAVARAGARAKAEGVPVFAGVRGGVGRLAVATETWLRDAGVTIRCDSTVREITRTGGGFRLVVGPTIAAEMLEADAVIVAVPAAAASRLLRDMVPRAAVELGRIDYASMAIVTLALAAAGPLPDLEGSGFLVPSVDRRIVKAVTYSTGKWGWLSSDFLVVRCSIGRYGDERHLQRADTELVDAALMDLREAVGLRARLADAVVTRWGGALPQYAVGHLDRVRRIREVVNLVPGLAVCGAAYDGLGVPACIATGVEAATRVAGHLGAHETMQA